MDCGDVKKILSYFLSGELDEAQNDDIRQHLMQCQDCQKELDVYKETWELLDIWEDQEPSVDYIPRFWERLASEQSWMEKWIKVLKPIFSDQRLLPVTSVICALFLIVFLTFRTTQTRQTEYLLTALTMEEIEFIENLELVENLDLLQEMDALESMEILDDISFDEQGSRSDHV